MDGYFLEDAWSAPHEESDAIAKDAAIQKRINLLTVFALAKRLILVCFRNRGQSDQSHSCYVFRFLEPNFFFESAKFSMSALQAFIATKEKFMSKSSKGKTVPITQSAVARVQRAEAVKHGGGVPKGNHVGRMQKVVANQQTNNLK